jgi:hypothetical protein
VDSDLTGNVTVILQNNGDDRYQINKGDVITQLLLLNILTPKEGPGTNPERDTMFTNSWCFVLGSATGLMGPPLEFSQAYSKQSLVFFFGTNPEREPIIVQPNIAPAREPMEPPQETPNKEPSENPNTPSHIPTSQPSTEHHEVLPDLPYDIYMSQDPFDNELEVELLVKGDHQTLGLRCELCPYRNRLRFVDAVISTPASRIPKWQSTLRNSYILAVNQVPIHSDMDLVDTIREARAKGCIKLKCKFATDKSYGIHPQEGVPQLYFNQLNITAQHLKNEAKVRALLCEPYQPAESNTTEELDMARPPDPEPPPETDRGKFYKLKQLKQRPDWPEWKISKYRMLDQYLNQGMFSNPQPLPSGANALYMLWTYFLKLCGTRKSRMVCNGNPRQKGIVTLGHTYANALDAASKRLFWLIVAEEGLIAIGADVTNAFAEAPPPKAPLYLYIDDSFREWWTEHLGKPPIPPECNVVRVHNAIQGHPESPRLWEKHIDKKLKELGLQPTTHEPCLYAGTIQEHRILFLRLVDDFAVVAKVRERAMALIQSINDKMQIDVKHLGIIERFNGVDVHQMQDYVNITCEKYLYNMLKSHNWLATTPHSNPIPLPPDTKYITQLEQAVVPNTIEEKQILKAKMRFNYRQVIGELIYPMMKCRPDISYHGTKLSQYMENPAEEHYAAVRLLCEYLAHTIREGIYYWRHESRMDLPHHPTPALHHNNYTMTVNPADFTGLTGYVDADWATDTKHRKSVTGIVLMHAGGVVGYKTKYQDTIALSSTEAEFTAACDAAKLILFFRSLMDDLNIPQNNTTILYEDNNGALLMANAQQPTRRTRHMEIKKSALLDWVERDTT